MACPQGQIEFKQTDFTPLKYNLNVSRFVTLTFDFNSIAMG